MSELARQRGVDVDPHMVDPDFLLTEEQFTRIRALAERLFGLSISPCKRGMVSNRIFRLSNKLGIHDMEALLARMEGSNRRDELLPLFDALSTNLTHFFREPQTLEVLSDRVLAPYRESQGAQRLRIWSAGCSNGCEPYTISMLLHEQLGSFAGRDVKVLATDFAVTELKTARVGEYPEGFLSHTSAERRRAFFEERKGADGSVFRVRPEVRTPVHFALLNLMDPWEMKGPFDAILCRNVIIYFDAPTRNRLIERFAALLRPGGLLLLGSAEGMPAGLAGLTRIAPSSYVREG